MSNKGSTLKTQNKTRKYTYHTRHSKQNTYHVTNKNIASSKIPMVVRRKRGCHLGASPSLVGCSFLDNSVGCRGIPKLRLFGVLVFYLGVPWESQSLGSCNSLFHNPSKINPKHENFTTQNLTENSWALLAKENKTTLQGSVMNSLFIYIGVKPTVLTSLWFISSFTSHRFIKISKQHTKNRIC